MKNWILTLALVLCAMVAAQAEEIDCSKYTMIEAVTSTGDGTETSPYKIATLNNLL